MVSQYVKIPQLKKILDAQEQPCEETLSQIRNLVDGGDSSLTVSGEATSNGQFPGNNANGNFNSYDKILKAIKNLNDRKTALSLLQEISKSDSLTWDPETLEIIISGETIKYTNIALLVKKIVSVAPASLPIGFVLFLASLQKIKAPHTLIRNGDAISVLENLSRLGGSVEPAATEPTQPAVEEQAEEPMIEQPSTESAITNINSKKREREDDGETESEENENRKKRQRDDEVDETAPKRDFDVPPDRLKKLRRSPRLKKSISDAWETVNNDRKTSKKRS